jgi:hypothetical protein
MSAESLGTVAALALPGPDTNRSSGLCRRYNTEKRALTLQYTYLSFMKEGL